MLRIPRPNGRPVELSNVASIVPARAPSRIDRLDRKRMVAVRGGVAPGFALGDRVEVLRGFAEGPEHAARPTRRARWAARLEMERTFREFIWAFVISVVFMYLIIASQFESLIHPVTILLVAAALGAVRARSRSRSAAARMNLFSALGILVLFGVVKKNSILQIDHINGLRAQGMPRLEAILLGNRDRLRPILMTTLTLVAGMLPLADRHRPRRRGAPRGRDRRDRRPDALPAADPDRDAGRLLALRRPAEPGEAEEGGVLLERRPVVEPKARPAAA